MPDDDFIDGCEIGPDGAIDDDDVDWIVLFADVDRTDRRAVRARRHEWQELFDES